MLSFDEWKKQKGAQISPTQQQAKTQPPRENGILSFDEWKSGKSSGKTFSQVPSSADIYSRRQSYSGIGEKEKVYAEPVDKMVTEEKRPGVVDTLKSAWSNLKSGYESANALIGSAIKSKGEALKAGTQEEPSGTLGNTVDTIEKAINPGIGINEFFSNAFSKTEIGKKINESIGGFLSTAGGKIEKYHSEKSREFKDQADPSLTMDNGSGGVDYSKLKDWRVLVNEGSSMLGQMVPAISASIATKNPRVGMLMMGLQEKGNAFQDYTEAMAKEKGVSVDELSASDIKKADEMSDYYGIASGLLESAGILSVLDKIGGKKVGQDILKRVFIETPVETVRTMFKEGTTEGLQQFVQNSIAKYSGIDEKRNLSEGVEQSAVGGAILGAPFGAMAGMAPGNSGEKNTPSQNVAPTDTQNPQVNAPVQSVPVKNDTNVPAPQNTPQTGQSMSENEAGLLRALADGEKKDVKKFLSSSTVEELANVEKSLWEYATKNEGSQEAESARAYVQEVKNERFSRIKNASQEIIDGQDVETATQGMPSEDKRKVIEFIDKASQNTDPGMENVKKMSEMVSKIREEQKTLNQEKKTLLEEKTKETDPLKKKEIQKKIDALDTQRKPEYVQRPNESERASFVSSIKKVDPSFDETVTKKWTKDDFETYLEGARAERPLASLSKKEEEASQSVMVREAVVTKAKESTTVTPTVAQTEKKQENTTKTPSKEKTSPEANFEQKKSTSEKKTYVAKRDTSDPKGRFWFSGSTRKLTDEQAKKYIEKKQAVERTSEPEPKRMVKITNPDGSVETVSWGDHLKRMHESRKESKKELPQTYDEIEAYLKKKYPNGIKLFHQTSKESYDKIVKNGFSEDSEKVFFTVEKYDKDRATAGGNESVLEITLQPEDYMDIEPDEGAGYNGETGEELFSDMIKSGFVGADITIQTETANKYIKNDEKTSEKIEKGSVENKNTDVGEKIGGARKDLYQRQIDSINEKYTDQEISEIPSAKSIPSLDYPLLIQNGVSEKILAVYTFFVSQIGKKPTQRSSYKMSKWVQTVQAFRDIAKKIVVTKNFSTGAVENSLSKSEDMRASVEMYKKFDFVNNEKIRKYGIIVQYYRKYGSEETVPRYSVTQFGRLVYDEKGSISSESIEEIYDRMKNFLEKDKKRAKNDFRKNIAVFIKGGNIPLIAYKKGGRFIELEIFRSLEEAKSAKMNAEKMREYVSKIEEAVNLDENSYRKSENENGGKSYRNGRNIGSEEFMETFGFRGVEFGNWVSQSERTDRLNMAYDAFKELSSIIGIPERSISLNGELGFAFGSRGVKGALAHYEPDKVVINITKKNGAGTIAHEWWHAFDNYLSRKMGKEKLFITETIEYDRKELKDAFDDLMKTIRSLPVYERSKMADKYKGSKYYTVPTEMGARAFEVFVKNKLVQSSVENDFLVNVLDMSDVSEKVSETYPYASGEEIEKVSEKMEKLFREVKVSPEEENFAPYNVKRSEKKKYKSAKALYAKGSEAIKANILNTYFSGDAKNKSYMEMSGFLDRIAPLAKDLNIITNSQSETDGAQASYDYLTSTIRLYEGIDVSERLPESFYHEIGHHLEKYLPEDMREELVAQFEKEKEEYLKKNPKARKAETMTQSEKLQFYVDNEELEYKYFSVGEYFAEMVRTKTQKELSEQYSGKSALLRAFALLRKFFEAVYRNIREFHGKNVADRAYRLLLSGENISETNSVGIEYSKRYDKERKQRELLRKLNDTYLRNDKKLSVTERFQFEKSIYSGDVATATDILLSKGFHLRSGKAFSIKKNSEKRDAILSVIDPKYVSEYSAVLKEMSEMVVAESEFQKETSLFDVSWDSQKESGYGKFYDTVRRYRSDKAKEILTGGDYDHILKFLLEKGWDSKDVDLMLYGDELESENDVLRSFQDRMEREDPFAFYGKNIAEGLGMKRKSMEDSLEKIERGKSMFSDMYAQKKKDLQVLYDKSKEFQEKLIDRAINQPEVFMNKYTLVRLGIKERQTGIKTTQEKLLKYKLRAMSKGARMGAVATRREILEMMRKKISSIQEQQKKKISEIKNSEKLKRKWVEVNSKENTKKLLLEKRLESANEKENVREIKEKIVEYIKNTLPLNERGKYLAMVKNVETLKQLTKAFSKIDVAGERSDKKILVSQLKKLIAEVNNSNQIAIDYKEKIQMIVENIDMVKRNPKTIERIQKAREYFKEQMKQGSDVVIPTKILRALSILEKKSVADMSYAEVANLYSEIESLFNIGKTKRAIMDAQREYKKSILLDQLVSETKSIESTEEYRAKIGEKLTAKERLKNVLARRKNSFIKTNLAINPMDTFFDILDNSAGYTGANYRIFKKSVDTSFQRYLDHKDKLQKSVVEMGKKFKFDERNYDRIGVYAVSRQEGGLEKLANLGIEKEEIDGIQLTQNEMDFYNEIRRIFDEEREFVSEFMRKVYNAPVGKVDNYFSFMTDFDKVSDMEMAERIVNAVEIGKGLTKTIQKGFTKSRKGAGSQKIKINAMDVFLKHTDDVSYLLEMGETTKTLFEIANSEKYKESAGDIGYTFVIEWLDTVARKGGLVGQKQLLWLDKLRSNYGMATLGFKLSTVLIQPSALFDGASIIGHYAFVGMKNVVSGKWRKFLFENMPEIRDRVGDDPAYSESGTSYFEKLRKISFKGIRVVDSLTASSIAIGAYKKYAKENGIKIDFTNPNKDALEYAQKVVRITQASALFKDVPLSISRGKITGNRSIERAFWQFQTFMLNRFAMAIHQIYRLGVKKGNYKKAIGVATWLFFSDAYAIMSRDVANAIIQSIFGGDGGDDKDFVDKFFAQLLGNIPFVGTAYEGIVYKGDLVPVLGAWATLTKGINTAIYGKKEVTKLKAVGDILQGAGQIVGMPGSVQMNQAYKMLLGK